MVFSRRPEGLEGQDVPLAGTRVEPIMNYIQLLTTKRRLLKLRENSGVKPDGLRAFHPNSGIVVVRSGMKIRKLDEFIEAAPYVMKLFLE